MQISTCGSARSQPTCGRIACHSCTWRRLRRGRRPSATQPCTARRARLPLVPAQSAPICMRNVGVRRSPTVRGRARGTHVPALQALHWSQVLSARPVGVTRANTRPKRPSRRALEQASEASGAHSAQAARGSSPARAPSAACQRRLHRASDVRAQFEPHAYSITAAVKRTSASLSSRRLQPFCAWQTQRCPAPFPPACRPSVFRE